MVRNIKVNNDFKSNQNIEIYKILIFIVVRNIKFQVTPHLKS